MLLDAHSAPGFGPSIRCDLLVPKQVEADSKQLKREAIQSTRDRNLQRIQLIWETGMCHSTYKGRLRLLPTAHTPWLYYFLV